MRKLFYASLLMVFLLSAAHRARRGELVGYRWGLERERALLAREAISAAPGANGT